MPQDIGTTIKGSPSRPPKSAGRVPFSAVKLEGGAQRSHIIPQKVAANLSRLFNLTKDAVLSDGERPFDPTDWLDNGQALPSNNLDAEGKAIFDLAQHNGSHPEVNALAERKLTVIYEDLNSALRFANSPEARNELLVIADSKIRNVADALAAISVGGIIDPNHPEIRAIYNLADPNARILWSDWDTLSDAAKKTRIAENLEQQFGKLVTASGDLTAEGAVKMKVLRDLTSDSVGALGREDVKIADKVLAHAAARGVDLSKVDALSYMDNHLEEIAPEGEALAERAAKLSKFRAELKIAAKVGVKVGGKVVMGALGALDLYDKANFTGQAVAAIRGDSKFGFASEEGQQVDGINYLKDLATKAPQQGLLSTIPLPPETIAGKTGEVALKAAVEAYLKENFELPTGLAFKVVSVTLKPNGEYSSSQTYIDDLSTPEIDNVQVIWKNPASGGSPSGAAMVLKRAGDVLIVQDVDAGTARAYLDPDQLLQNRLVTAATDPDPAKRQLAKTELDSANPIPSAPVTVVDGNVDPTSAEQALVDVRAHDLSGSGITLEPDSGSDIVITGKDKDHRLVTVVIDGVVHVVQGLVGEIEQFLNALGKGPGVLVNDLRNFGKSGQGLIDFADVGQILGAQLSNALAIHDPWARIGASTAIGSLLTNIGQSLDLLGSSAGDAGKLGMSEAIDKAFSDFGSDVLQAGTGAVSSYLVGNLLAELGLKGTSLDAAVAFAGPTIGKIAFNAVTGASWNAGLTTGFFATAAASFLGSKLADTIVSFDSLTGQIGAAVGEAVGTIIAVKLFEGSLATGNPYAIAAAAIVIAVSKIIGGLIGSLFGPSTSSASIVWDEQQQKFSVDHVTSKRGGSKDAARALSGSVSDAFNAVLNATGSKLLEPIEEQRFGMRNRDYIYWNAPAGYGVGSRSKDFNDVLKFGIKVGMDRMIGQLGGGDVFVKRALLNDLAAQTARTLDMEGILGDFSIAKDYGRYLSNQSSLHNLIFEQPDTAFAAGWIATLARAHELGIDRRAVTDWVGGWGVFLDEMNDGSIDGSSWSAGAVRLEFNANTKERLFGFIGEDGEVNAYIADTIDSRAKTNVVGTAGGDVIRIVGDQLQAGSAQIRQLDGSLSTVAQPTRINLAAIVDAGLGDDLVIGGDLGNDIFGDAGNDTLYGGRLDDWLFGGDGDDTLDAGTQGAGLGGDGNYLDGGAGNDILRGREGSDWLEGGDGVDTLTGGDGDDILAGGAGEGDDLKGGTGDDQYLVRLGDGADIAEDQAVGAPAAQPGGDYVSQRFAGLLSGIIKRNWVGDAAGVTDKGLQGGEDAIVFGQGIDMGDIMLFRSSTDSDDLIIRVMQTVDGVTAFSGTQLTVKDWFSDPFKRVEWLKFVDGNEVRIGDVTSFIVGGSGNDVLIGTAGNDFVYGGAGDDALHLLAGNDIGNGGTGNDLIAGDSGSDLLLGGLGMDELIGGKGADVLSGDGGADDLYGGNDADILSGGRGDGDQIVGGAGNDTFKYSRGDGRDTMFDDFSANWQTVWTNGTWNTAAGYAYVEATGEVTGPNGAYLRKNLGTAAAPDLQWVGRFDYDSDTGTLRYFSPPPGAAIVANAGTDTIEFAPGIDIQDIVLWRPAGTNDLVLSIGSENAEFSTAASISDSVTIKDWYLSPGQIERLAFYQTGILDISPGATNLIAGTDAANGTAATPLSGTAGADWITGGAGDDVVSGGAGNDIIAGNSGSDTLKGESGDDVIYGGAGNDSLDGGLGADILIGGTGLDTASYLSAGSGVKAYLSASFANTGDASGDQYTSIENLAGGGGSDVLGGDEGDNELTGGQGADTLLGGEGDDTYFWNTGDGADVIRDASFRVDEAVTAAGTLAAGYTQSLWQSTGILQPGFSNRYYWRLQITGPGGEVVYDYDRFAPTDTNATQPNPVPAVYNVAGWLGGFTKTNGQQVTREKFDTSVNAGEDVLEFGAGISLSDLTFITGGVDLIVQVGGSATSQVTIKDHFAANGNSRIETLQFRDGLAVSLASIMTAANGNLLTGTAGDDLMIGQTGSLADQLDGGAGDDVLSGGAGNDRLLGGAGDDQMEGGAGADFIDGGTHSASTVTAWGDTARYVRSSAGVQVDLNNTTTGQAGGDAAGDVLVGIENLTGSDLGDTLTGDEGGNRIDGLDGDNIITGNGGDDILVAGAGADKLYGGAGDDGIAAGAGNDELWGGDGKDQLNGGDGNDYLYGEAGNDALTGGDGNDNITAGDGDDTIDGGAGSDWIDGGAGNDVIAGGLGSDTLQGGDGDDVYTVDSQSGDDFVIDFYGKNNIVFDSSVSLDQLWLTRSGNDLRISVIGSTTRLTLVGYFGTGTHTLMRSVSTATHSLFLGYSTALIDAMTAIQASTPSAMPDSIKAQLAAYWYAGGKAAPQAAPIEITTNEDQASALTSVGAIDPDENIQGYAIGTGPAHGAVVVNAVDGKFVYTPDANFSGEDHFSVVVKDADGQAADVAVKVNVNAVNDAPGPISVVGGAALSVVEGGPGSPTVYGTEIGRFAAVDPEGDNITFSILSDANHRFAVSADGILTVLQPGWLDNEYASLYTIKVRADDGHGGVVDQYMQIAVADRNEANALPATYSMSVNENVVIGTTVGVVAATDLDSASAAFGQQRYYFLNAGVASATSSDGRYTIDAVSGMIKTAAVFNFETGSTSAAYTVVARDNQGNAGYNQAASTVTIGITDVNEANHINPTFAMTVAENEPVGTSVGTVVATDDDGAGTVFGQQRYYFLTAAGASATSSDGRYTIDAVSGVIKTAATFNYETDPTSTAYTVAARDNQGNAGFNQVTSTVTIGITDVNDANHINPIYAMSVAENQPAGTSVGTVVATDDDGAGTAFGQQRYYFLNAGVASATSSDGRYTIDAVSGVIKTVAALNFEAGTTSAAYTVIARDNQGNAGYNQAASTVTIGITDVNEANHINPTFAMTVAENQPVGTSVGTVVATDDDGVGTVFGQQRYYFLNAGVASATSSDGRYTIDAVSGVIKTAVTFNYETGPTSAAYTVAARDNQGNTGFNQVTSTVTIGITDANEANHINPTYAMTVAENQPAGTSVGTVVATDDDGAATAFGQQRYYFLNAGVASATSSDGRYTIDAVSGVIKTAASLDFEAGTPSVAYTVAARDNQGNAGFNQVTSTVTIGITDVNEANHINPTFAMTVAENQPVGTSVGTVVATDDDGVGTVFGQQRYYFLNAGVASATSSDGRYTIDAVSGVIKTAVTFNYETGPTSAAYTVAARDNQGNTGFNQVTSTVTIGITDANEANHINPTYAMTVAENQPAGTSVGTVVATDDDGAATAFGQQRYYFLNAGVASATSSDGRYTIDAVSGVIKTAASLDFEAGTPSVAYTVAARDNQGNAGYNQVTSTVTIAVTDVNEAPSALNWTPTVASVAERDRVASGTSLPVISLGSFAVVDPDAAGTPFNNYTYTVSDSRFEMVGGTLRLKLGAALDFEAGNTVSVTVTAIDQTGTPFSIQRAVSIAVTDQDDVLEGDAGANSLIGQQNRDLLYGFGGNDVLDGGAGDDRLDGGAGIDRLIGGSGIDTLYGGDDGDTLIGGIGNDTLYGGANGTGTVDRLYGDDGNDSLTGDDGDDYLIGGVGADQLIGGAGEDWADYSELSEGVAATAAVGVDLVTPGTNTGVATGDTYSAIENVRGTGFADTLQGDGLGNKLYGLAGNDLLRGRAGDDQLVGDAGADTLYGDDGADILDGGDGDDIIYGGAGNDTLIGGAGNDTLNAESGDDSLDGGAGNDTLIGGVDNDTYIVTRTSDADTIYNYDPSGADIDVLGFQDSAAGVIVHEDLWFERSGNDMIVSVIGTTSSARIVNWYTTPGVDGSNYKIDFIIAGERYSTNINVEGLVGLMATKTKPSTTAQRDTLMADLNYKAQWATYWGTNAAPTLAAIANQAVAEDGTLTLTVTATDDITPNAGLQVTASVISGAGIIAASGLVFGAPNSAGQRSLTIKPNANASGVATIRVQAIDAGGVTSVKDFSVTVNAAPDQPTIAQFSGGSGTSGLGGIPLSLNVTFPDMDGSEVQEIWIAGVPVGVSLSAGTYDSAAAVWKLSPAQANGLQVIAPAGWSQDLALSVTARATEGGQTAISSAVATTVVINAPPTSLAFTGSVNENAPNATAVGTVTAVDPDSGDTLTYTLVDNAGGRFSITSAGALQVANSTLLNYEAATSHNIVVRVTDSFGQFKDQTFAVTVNNLNEANNINATYAMAVAENVAVGTSVGTVVATDADSAATAFGQQRYYFLNAGVASGTSSDGRYTIDAITGVIKTAALSNFEAGATSAAYTVVARDNQGAVPYNQATSTVTIGITDVNEANSIAPTYAMTVAENLGIGSIVGTVAATDIDGAGVAFGQQRYYFLNAGVASGTSADGRYTIDAITGVIKTAALLNFEAGTASVAYTVVARDNLGAAGYNQATSTVTIGITDVNEANNIAATYAMSVAENVAVGTSVGTVLATDADSGATAFGQQRYYFLNAGVASGTSSDGRYTIDAITGVIKTAALFNFEAGTTSAAYTVVARDNQGAVPYNQATSTVTIGITDVNEANSITPTYAMTVAENLGIGSIVGTVAATDIDGAGVAFGQQRYYFLNAGVASGTSADGRYTIDAITGVIKTAAVLNFEAGTTSVAYTVAARDNLGAAGYNQATSTVTIGITDANEPNHINPTFAMTVAENRPAGTIVGTVVATDDDGTGTAFGQQRYYFLNAGVASATSSDGRYTIDAVSGVIITAAVFNFESGPTSATYTVAARDNQGNAGFNQVTSTVTIGITDVNEANSIAPTYAMTVAENLGIGSIVGTVAATDIDGAGVAFGQQRYYFLNAGVASGTSADGRYTIDAITGVIKTAALLNFEAGTASVAYTVVARDNLGAAGYNQATSTVTIGITDVNEANSITPTYTMTVAENVAVGTSVGAVVATDADGTGTAFGQQRYYFLNAGIASATSSDGRYTIDAVSGVITTAAALNFEVGATSVAYTVVARDNLGNPGYTQASSTVTIGITDVNEANNIPATYAMNVAENVAVGTSVGTVAAGDIDGAGTLFGQQRYYFLNSGTASATSSDGRYTIDALTGVIRTAAALNFEAGATSVAYTVAARDNQGAAGYIQANSTVTIGVTNLNEANSIAPTYAMTVAENVAVGTSVGTVLATDADSSATAFGQQRYYFLSAGVASGTSSDGRYAIDAVTGLIKTAAALDYEAGSTSVTYTVVARDNQGVAGYNQAATSVTIGIANVNEAHSLSPITINLAEGPSPGPLVPVANLAPMLNDPEHAAMNWSFADGSYQSGLFQINPTDGTISLIGSGVDYEELVAVYETRWVDSGRDPYGQDWVEETVYVGDDPSRATFNLAVKASDGTFSSTATATVNITNVNEGPVLTSANHFYQRAGNNSDKYSIGRLTGFDPETKSTNVSFQLTNFRYEEYLPTYSGSSGLNSGAPSLWVNADGSLDFSASGNEWEGGIADANGSRTAFLNYYYDLKMTDASGASSLTPIVVTFMKKGYSSVPPIVLDLDGDGIELVDKKDSTVSFDMDLDGIADRTGWAGHDDGFLVLDRNGNGVIDDASELSFTSDAAGAMSDIEGLRAFDTNANGFFDAGDTRFGEFRIWQDANQDGISQADELKSLADRGFVQINLSINLNQEAQDTDNILYATTEYLRADGTSGAVGDVFLGYDPSEPYTIAPPIVLDMDDDNAALVGLAASKARFDMDGDGVAERTGWIESGDAFLALDRNNDGKITDIAEISFVGDLLGAKTDLEGLKAFDSNGDGILSALDARFAEFKLWFDTNGNGVSDAGEVRSLAEAGLVSLNLSSVAATGRDDGGNIVYGTGSFTRSTGKTGMLLDAGLAYLRGDGTGSTGYSSWNGTGTPSTDANVAKLPGVDVGRQNFSNKASKYMVSSVNGEMFIGWNKAGKNMDARAGSIGPASVLSFKKSTYGMLSAIVLDLDGDGADSRRMKKSNAHFDMNGDGTRDDTGWVGQGDGFLVIDRNGDGLINTTSELAFLSDKDQARSEFDALSALDSNKDGKLDAIDARFGELRVWVDANDNGVTDAGELKTLADHGIASINLAARAVNENVPMGNNVMIATSAFTRVDGSTGSLGEIGLAYRPADTASAGTIRSVLSDWPDAKLVAMRRSIESGVAEHLPVQQAAIEALASDGAGSSQGIEAETVASRVDVTQPELRSTLPAPNIDAQLAALRHGLDGDRFNDFLPRVPVARLVANDGDEGVQGAQDLSREDVPPGPVEISDLRPVLMAQTMAAFGARSGEANWRESSGRDGARFDYFAA